MFTILALLVAFCVPLLHVSWWPRRDWRFVVLLAWMVLGGWLLLIGEAAVASASHHADVFERRSAGLRVSSDEIAQDDVADNAMALFLGWIIPALGAGAGWAITAAHHRLRPGATRQHKAPAPGSAA